MYRFLLAVMLSLSIAHVFSQNRTREYTLKQSEQQVSTSLYDTIILLDKRDIKDNLGIVQVGAFNAKAQVIAEPSLEKQLQVQLINAVSGDRGRGQLLLRLDKFCIAELTGAFSESGYFDFTAVLFSKDGTDSYREIASIDTSLTVGGLDVTKKILNKSSQIVNEFIVNNLNANPANEVAHSLADIDRYHEYLKKEIPLYKRTIPEDGLYADYEEFRQQKPSAGLVEIKKNKPALGFYQKNGAGKLKKIVARNYYAAVIDGQAYISCLGKFYPLSMADGEYYFTGPAKETASASDVVAASILFGAIGGVIASSATNVTYYQKLDFRNGSFVKIERR